jgi:ABC-2 type transport system ATP-binding protein
MTAAIEAVTLSKAYRRRYALQDCDLVIPAGKVVGLVGPNGAGKTTLLHLAVGLIAPTAGTIRVLGRIPGGAEHLAQVGFVAQDTPIYPGLTVADHLHLGRALNPRWDDQLAHRRVAELDIDPAQKAARLSGGQRAQLALTLAIAKRPDLLILDEPVASLDPLARRHFAQSLMEIVAEQGVSVVLSSHLLADLERLCDYLVVLVASQVLLAGDVEQLLATHYRLIGPRQNSYRLPAHQDLVESSSTARQSTLLVRSQEPIVDPRWQVERVGLEDLLLAYMSQPQTSSQARTLQAVQPVSR